MVDEENALEMVHLMLEAGGEQAVQPLLVLLAVAIEPACGDHCGALDLGILVGDRQTAFVIDRMLLGLRDDLRVDEYERPLHRFAAFFLRLLKVDHQQPLSHADLDRRQADAGRVVHRLEHVVDERLELVVESLDGGGNDAKPRVGRLDDGQDGHGAKVGFALRVVNVPARHTSESWCPN